MPSDLPEQSNTQVAAASAGVGATMEVTKGKRTVSPPTKPIFRIKSRRAKLRSLRRWAQPLFQLLPRSASRLPVECALIESAIDATRSAVPTTPASALQVAPPCRKRLRGQPTVMLIPVSSAAISPRPWPNGCYISSKYPRERTFLSTRPRGSGHDSCSIDLVCQ